MSLVCHNLLCHSQKIFLMLPSSYFSDKVINSSYIQRILMHSHYLKVWVKVQGDISNVSYKIHCFFFFKKRYTVFNELHL